MTFNTKFTEFHVKITDFLGNFNPDLIGNEDKSGISCKLSGRHWSEIWIILPFSLYYLLCTSEESGTMDPVLLVHTVFIQTCLRNWVNPRCRLYTLYWSLSANYSRRFTKFSFVTPSQLTATRVKLLHSDLFFINKSLLSPSFFLTSYFLRCCGESRERRWLWLGKVSVWLISCKKVEKNDLCICFCVSADEEIHA